MADSAELAFNEVANEIDLTNEISFKIQRADTTCNNTNKAKNAAKKLIEEGVDAIIGAACPEITKKIAEEIFIPKKVLMISPADSSNELTGLKDNNYVFRTTPSKIRGSQILADITKDRGIRNLAISYSSNKDYKKFAEAFDKALKKNNIKTSVMVPHNQSTNDYSKHISTLTAAGGDALAIISDINSGGDKVIKSMLDIGMFNTFILPDGMIEEDIINNFKEKNLKKSFGYMPGLSNLGSKKFVDLAQKSGIDPNSPYTNESYDAAAIIILTNFAKIYSETDTNNIIYDVANKPGVKIYPGEIKKAIEILETVDLKPGRQFLYKYPHEMSGGECQRVCIARSLIPKPKLIIADEPTSMLDVSIREEILKLFLTLKKKGYLFNINKSQKH